jgi:hypothetical protein
VLQLKVAEQLFAFTVMLEFDDDEEFRILMMTHVHHCMHIVQFLSTLDNLLMEITLIRLLLAWFWQTGIAPLTCFILGGVTRSLGSVLHSSWSCTICWSFPWCLYCQREGIMLL